MRVKCEELQKYLHFVYLFLFLIKNVTTFVVGNGNL